MRRAAAEVRRDVYVRIGAVLASGAAAGLDVTAGCQPARASP
jgi:hypothetical protein